MGLNIGSSQEFAQMVASAWHEARLTDPFGPLKSESEFATIHVRHDISLASVMAEKKGKSVGFNIRRPITGAGRMGDEVVYGHEAVATYGFDSVIVDILKHATKVGKAENMHTKLNLMRDAMRDMREWLKQEYFITFPFTKLTGGTYQAYNTSDALGTFGEAGTTPSNLAYPIGCSSLNGIAAEDGLTVKLIRKLKLRAMNAHYGHIIAPGVVKGLEKPVYTLICSLEAGEQLKEDPEYQKMLLEAAARGKSNPVFTDEMQPVYDVRIVPHDAVPTVENELGTTVAKNLFLGRQAAVWAECSEPVVDQESLGYPKLDPMGVAIGIAGGMDQAVFDDDSISNGLIMCYTSSEEP